MVRKKKVVSKSKVVATVVGVDEPVKDLPSILDDGLCSETQTEVFFLCEDIETKISPGCSQSKSATRWAEEVENEESEAVLGANPPFRVFEGFVKRIWGHLGIDKIIRMHSGFTLFSFRDEVTRDIVLEIEVVHFDKKPMVLRPWSVDMDTVNMVRSVPVWIRLNSLGLQYWSRNNLSAMVSIIGKPIMIDKVTKDGSIVLFARVLVDMEISDNPPKMISYINERNQLMDQSVEYDWLPTKCTACDLLGHTVANCSKDKGLVWVGKQKGNHNGDQEKGRTEASAAAQGKNKKIVRPNKKDKLVTVQKNVIGEAKAIEASQEIDTGAGND
uniref:DUF4283 domain-containing protein n=1 Tax=Cannabis sativa TaxID=3483 RepID=A0A803PBZ5_CANSA